MKKTAFTFGCIAISMAFQSCEKDKESSAADSALFSEVMAGGYTYYQNGDLLPGASASPHGSFKLRFNSVAWAVLDSLGELPAGNSFPTGSILVKEIFNVSTLNKYAVMKKDPSNANAGNGWVWAEFHADGSASFTTGKKGDGCTSCHGAAPNRDLVRTFDLH